MKQYDKQKNSTRNKDARTSMESRITCTLSMYVTINTTHTRKDRHMWLMKLFYMLLIMFILVMNCISTKCILQL